jgi:uncharacterized membrane protein YqjE
MLDQSTGEGMTTQEKSIGDLFGDLARELGTLVRQEIQLAKVEMSAKAAQAGRDAGMVAVGGTLAHAGLLAVIAGIILALGTIVPLWISALFVGLIVLAVGAVVVRSRTQAMKRIDSAPRQTLETLKEDAQWARERAQ